MSKFTKLNIGDAVASSGGRVWKKLSVEPPIDYNTIVGTWVINEGDLNDSMLTATDVNTTKILGTFYGLANANAEVLTEQKLKWLQVSRSNQTYCYRTRNLAAQTPPCTSILRKGKYSGNTFNAIYFTTNVNTKTITLTAGTDGYEKSRTLNITEADTSDSNVTVIHEWLKANATKIS